MALIYFYDATELDQQQISAYLEGTDHHWEYVDNPISSDACNPETEVISVFVTSQITREIIESLPKLKLIACRSTGFDHIDLEAARDHNVTVVNVPTYGESTVAEYTFALLLALTRRLPATFQPEGDEFSREQLRGHDLEGKTLGIIGTGHIGQKVLKIANGFSMNIIAYDAYPQLALQEQYNFNYVELDELLARSDIITLHAPYLPATHHMMNHARLSAMKQGAILVNTARGELVDTTALTELLAQGHLGGAALDVIEDEVLLHYHEQTALLQNHAVSDETLHRNMEISVLKKMPNVILSPHNAFNTIEAIQRINQTTVKNIIDFWYDKMPNKVMEPKKTFGKLLIARHTESEWNATGRWTGITDVHLSDKGFKDSVHLGHTLRSLNIPIDIAYCSEQIRTHETLGGMLDASQQFDVDIIRSSALNERDYGDYTGKNKWEIKALVGEDSFAKLRRGWDIPIPDGETLEMVYKRTVPFYIETILPLLKNGKNVLIVAHGNSLRALIKYLESISDEDITNLEMPFGQIIVYDISPEGQKVSSSIAKIDTNSPNA